MFIMAKKIRYCLFLLPFLSLTFCNKPKENNTHSNLIFTEFYCGSNIDDSAVEIANIGNKDIDLSKYSFYLYQSGSKNNKIKIPMSGVLSPESTYVITSSKASEEIKNLSNLVSDVFKNDGSWPMTLNKGSSQLDVFGYVGFASDFGCYLDLVRKNNYRIGRYNYHQYDYIRYSSGHLSGLGNLNNDISEEELLEGPHLTDEDFATPFATDEFTAGGGAVKVTLASTGDGDTTRFIFPSSLSAYGISSNESVRYMCINTPETQHGTSINADPWGYAAKDYNNEQLRKAKAFAVSTSKGYYLRENYGRIMGYVWVAFVDNPTPKDYYNLNFLMVKEAYSTLRFINGRQENDPMFYREITYTNYMKNAELIVEEQGLRVHGEKDPNFDYGD